MAEAFTTPEIGGDHFRASSVFLTQAHPKQTMGSDLFVGTSFDQIYARQFGQDTAIPSMQLCIEAVDHSGGCEYNYSCAYTDAISWASPSEPLPMLRDPRAVFDTLFGAGATPEERARRRREDKSVLDTIVASIDRLKRQLGAADRARLSDYLDDVREIERRIQNIEAANRSGETRELPNAPMGVPDSYDEHVKLMFDLQAVALASDITRVFAFKLSRDVSGRVFPSDRRHHRLPQRLAPQRAAGAHSGLREDQQVPRQPGAVLPRAAEADAGRRRHAARQHADRLRLADGQPERAQSQALPAVPGRQGGRPVEGRAAHQGAGRHADGERVPVDGAHARDERPGVVRRQHRRVRPEQGRVGQVGRRVGCGQERQQSACGHAERGPGSPSEASA